MQELHTGNGHLLSADDVQRLFGVDRSTIYRMAGDGRLPAVKIGRQWRFPADRIAQMLQIDVVITELPRDSAKSTAPGTIPTVPLDVAEPLVKVAADLLGVMMLVTDMDGRPLTSVSNPAPWFAERSTDESVVAECVQEWRELAADPDLEVRFRLGHLDFECARAFIRSGTELIGMVIAGGVAAHDSNTPGLYRLSTKERQRVLTVLPKVAAAISRVASPDLLSEGRNNAADKTRSK